MFDRVLYTPLIAALLVTEKSQIFLCIAHEVLVKQTLRSIIQVKQKAYRLQCFYDSKNPYNVERIFLNDFTLASEQDVFKNSSAHSYSWLTQEKLLVLIVLLKSLLLRTQVCLDLLSAFEFLSCKYNPNIPTMKSHIKVEWRKNVRS